jgi:hypothetical protein
MTTPTQPEGDRKLGDRKGTPTPARPEGDRKGTPLLYTDLEG